MQLKNAEQSPSQKKKPFLRKGQGLSRFNYSKSGPPKTKVTTESKRRSLEIGVSNENKKRHFDQSAVRDTAGNQKHKKDNKV